MVGKLTMVTDVHTNQPRTDNWYTALLNESFNLYLRVALLQNGLLGTALLMEHVSFEDDNNPKTRVIETSAITSVNCEKDSATITTRNSVYTFKLPFELEKNMESGLYEMSLETIC